ncbi:arylsulfatase [Novosphingobium sp. BL-52-GroH]|uniref:arylsulfatase n=1 Tax=Novosphingobium sp. BL-52-GroH TaxID=3349877 RepID=UPI00384DF95C
MADAAHIPGSRIALTVIACLASACSPKPAPQAAIALPRPNVVVILADDLGYSDIGAFGGEIATPNLDALASAGLRLTDFHAAPSCSPTRSMLLSGTDNHTAGVGAMAEVPMDRTRWGYEGVLTPRVATLAERLREGGYETLMAGKWHLGMTPEENPKARGFDHSFALLQGAHNHFGKGGFGPDSNPSVAAYYTQDGTRTSIPANFYSSDYFTTKLIDQIDGTAPDKPLFAYLAFTAPHSPLQAPAADIARYRGRYDTGWAVLREQRLARMKALGLLPRDVAPAPLRPDAASWDKLSPEEKRAQSRQMEIYAAMVDRLDQNVGRLVAALRRTGRYDNTIFIFSSDNGPAGERMETYAGIPGQTEYLKRFDKGYENMGSATSFVLRNPYWAQASSAPSAMFKGWMTEGGTHVAAFITYAGFKRQGSIGRAFGDVMDIVPTVLSATSVPLTPTVAGRPVAAVRGRSMVPYLLERTETVHATGDKPVVMELHGQRSVRQGRWKLLSMPAPMGTGQWQLYDLDADRAEQHDVAAQNPAVVESLRGAWNRYATEARIQDGKGMAVP